MPLPVGARLGPYEVVAALGAGGMGEVYRARDTRLNRDVALKVLPEQFASQPERVARFEREAHLLASLNHPHIAQIYAVENIPSTRSGQVSIRALAMELVPGRTLGDLIGVDQPLAMNIDASLAIARQIAGALEAAHEKGIIHRDLKPGNVMITPEGEVKLLDFGLGKSLADEAESDPSNSPTLAGAATRAGVLLGTAAYMAPEQAKGHAVDKRGDIWAFGCVLYEMLTGQRAFAGQHVSDTLAAILRDEPDWSALPSDAPPHIHRLLVRCLEKDRKGRLRDIGDVLLELNDAGAGPATGSVAPPAPRASRPTWRVHLMWLAGGLTLAAIATATTWRVRAPAPEPETRLEITTQPTTDWTFAISPDARQVVFVAPSNLQPMLWLRPLDSTAARPLPGTEGGTNPFWSPDSTSIGFFAGAKLKRLDLARGAPQTLGDAVPNAGGAWSASNVILYRPAGVPVLARIPASGGESIPVTKRSDGATSDVQPQFLPDGRQFVFFRNGPNNIRGIYLASLDGPQVTRLTDADAAGRFIAGWLAYVRQGSLVARRVDVKGRVLSGDTVPIADGVVVETGGTRRAGFSTSASGVISYRVSQQLRRQLTWFDRKGAVVGTLGPIDETLAGIELSPDGRRAAVQRSGNIWLIDALRTTRFTFGQTPAEFLPLWSPTGSHVGYLKSITGVQLFGEFLKPSDGGGAEQLLTEDASFMGMTSWSRDGRFILVDKTVVDIWVIPTDPGKKPFPFIEGTPFAERAAQFSPDGRWVSYESNESGRTEIYIRPFSVSASAIVPGGQWQVSTAGGAQSRWSHDGKELYWIAPDGKLMAAAITVRGNSIESGMPVALFQSNTPGGWNPGHRAYYSVAPDGRFLMIRTLDDNSSSPITVIQHWQGLGR